MDKSQSSYDSSVESSSFYSEYELEIDGTSKSDAIDNLAKSKLKESSEVKGTPYQVKNPQLGHRASAKVSASALRFFRGATLSDSIDQQLDFFLNLQTKKERKEHFNSFINALIKDPKLCSDVVNYLIVNYGNERALDRQTASIEIVLGVLDALHSTKPITVSSPLLGQFGLIKSFKDRIGTGMDKDLLRSLEKYSRQITPMLESLDNVHRDRARMKLNKLKATKDIEKAVKHLAKEPPKTEYYYKPSFFHKKRAFDPFSPTVSDEKRIECVSKLIDNKHSLREAARVLLSINDSSSANSKTLKLALNLTNKLLNQSGNLFLQGGAYLEVTDHLLLAEQLKEKFKIRDSQSIAEGTSTKSIGTKIKLLQNELIYRLGEIIKDINEIDTDSVPEEYIFKLGALIDLRERIPYYKTNQAMLDKIDDCISQFLEKEDCLEILKNSLEKKYFTNDRTIDEEGQEKGNATIYHLRIAHEIAERNPTLLREIKPLLINAGITPENIVIADLAGWRADEVQDAAHLLAQWNRLKEPSKEEASVWNDINRLGKVIRENIEKSPDKIDEAILAAHTKYFEFDDDDGTIEIHPKATLLLSLYPTLKGEARAAAFVLIAGLIDVMNQDPKQFESDGPFSEHLLGIQSFLKASIEDPNLQKLFGGPIADLQSIYTKHFTRISEAPLSFTKVIQEIGKDQKKAKAFARNYPFAMKESGHKKFFEELCLKIKSGTREEKTSIIRFLRALPAAIGPSDQLDLEVQLKKVRDLITDSDRNIVTAFKFNIDKAILELNNYGKTITSPIPSGDLASSLTDYIDDALPPQDKARLIDDIANAFRNSYASEIANLRVSEFTTKGEKTVLNEISKITRELYTLVDHLLLEKPLRNLKDGDVAAKGFLLCIHLAEKFVADRNYQAFYSLMERLQSFNVPPNISKKDAQIYNNLLSKYNAKKPDKPLSGIDSEITNSSALNLPPVILPIATLAASVGGMEAVLDTMRSSTQIDASFLKTTPQGLFTVIPYFLSLTKEQLLNQPKTNTTPFNGKALFKKEPFLITALKGEILGPEQQEDLLIEFKEVLNNSELQNPLTSGELFKNGRLKGITQDVALKIIRRDLALAQYRGDKILLGEARGAYFALHNSNDMPDINNTELKRCEQTLIRCSRSSTDLLKLLDEISENKVTLSTRGQELLYIKMLASIERIKAKPDNFMKLFDLLSARNINDYSPKQRDKLDELELIYEILRTMRAVDRGTPENASKAIVTRLSQGVQDPEQLAANTKYGQKLLHTARQIFGTA